MNMTKKEAIFTYEVGTGHISWANFQRRETTCWEDRKMIILHMDDEEYCITMETVPSIFVVKDKPRGTQDVFYTFHRTGGEEQVWHKADAYRDLLIYLWYEEFP